MLVVLSTPWKEIHSYNLKWHILNLVIVTKTDM